MRCASTGGSGRRSPVNNWARTVAAAALALTVGTVAQEPSIGLPVRIDMAGGTRAANETSVSVSETDPGQIVAAFNDWRESSDSTERIRLGVAVSLDGGATWSDFLLRPPTINQSLIEGDAMTADRKSVV